ncbi:aldehyde dehydrogenase family protein, partial [Tenacibaculum discolor]
VMDDADLDQAVDLAIKGGLSLAGQACTGTSRVLVMKQVRSEFTARLLARVQAIKIGSGLTSGMEMGPLATARPLETVLRYVAIGKAEATHLYGGDRLTGAGFDGGYFVSPAIFT